MLIIIYKRGNIKDKEMKNKCVLLLFSVIVLGFLVIACELMPENGDDLFPGGFQNEWKIGLLTGPAHLHHEEHAMADFLLAEFGPDRIVTDVFPADFMNEQAETVAVMEALADDPLVKAIVMVQAVPGAAAAVDAVRALRPEMFIILGTSQEDPDLLAGKADLIFNINDTERGYQIAEQAHAMGAETLVHYSFPRHMEIEFLSTRRDLMKEKAEELEMLFIEVHNVPDPAGEGEGGVPATQGFIIDDVPLQVAEYGVETAFFGTNCAMMEPLIKTVFAEGAIFPVQCCPSPFHGMPGAFEIEVPADKQFDTEWMIQQITAVVEGAEMSGRISTWPLPVNMAFLKGGTYYAAQYLEERTNGPVDAEMIELVFSEVVGGISLKNYADTDNFYLVLLDHILF